MVDRPIGHPVKRIQLSAADAWNRLWKAPRECGEMRLQPEHLNRLDITKRHMPNGSGASQEDDLEYKDYISEGYAMCARPLRHSPYSGRFRNDIARPHPSSSPISKEEAPFRLEYLPVIDVKHGNVVVRADVHIDPNDSIADLDLFRATCNQLAFDAASEIGLEQKEQSHYRLGIQISPEILLKAAFIPELQMAILSAPIDLCDRLEIELLAQACVHDIQRLKNPLRTCLVMGIGNSIATLGRNKSMWKLLIQLPFTTLKLDPTLVASLVDDQEARSIAASLIKLAAGMNLLPIACGVSSQDQAAILVDMGCSSMQGSWVAPPMEAKLFFPWKIHKEKKRVTGH